MSKSSSSSCVDSQSTAAAVALQQSSMLKDKSQQLSFEDKWPQMRPTILKLLRQETVTRHEFVPYKLSEKPKMTHVFTNLSLLTFPRAPRYNCRKVLKVLITLELSQTSLSRAKFYVT